MTSIPPFPEQNGMQGEICVVLVDVTTGERLIVRALPVIIGRKDVSTPTLNHETEILYLKDKTVSRSHAELTADMGQLFLMDFSSKNGTFVNDERLPPNERRKVASGDMVCFGRAEYRIMLPPCEQEAELPKKERSAFHVPVEIEQTPANDELSIYIKQPKKLALFPRLFRKKEHNNVRPTERIKHDPIEDDVRYIHIFQEVDAELDKKFPVETRLLGSCHEIWCEKKRILKERYGIDWKTPDELNPRVMFD